MAVASEPISQMLLMQKKLLLLQEIQNEFLLFLWGETRCTLTNYLEKKSQNTIELQNHHKEATAEKSM